MKILVLGSGGREHALVWKLAQSPAVTKVICCPGNAGTMQDGDNSSIDADCTDELLHYVQVNNIDLTVVGPEVPLVSGIVDVFEEYGFPIFGPSKAAAVLEGSKAYAKDFMAKYQIPTARYQTFPNATETDIESVKTFVSTNAWAKVLKADGLAAGKGVLVCNTDDDAAEAIHTLMVDKQFGRAGDKIVVEEKLTGQELSLLVFTDGKSVVPMLPSQDYKQVGEGDKGPNTGGMGAHAPVPFVDEIMLNHIKSTIIDPTIQGLQQENITYKGVLYFGLMLTDDGPKVLEFNCRFGDPETQPVLYLLKSDLADIMLKIINGTLNEVQLDWKPGYAACIVMAAGGYPGAYEKGKIITGFYKVEALDTVKIFHAGTKDDGKNIVTNGGRVLGVTAGGETLQAALDAAYGAVDCIDFELKYYRPDIGFRALQHG